jgi:hypothetical protein
MKPPCTCIDEMNAKLAPHNTRLGLTFGFPRDGGPSTTAPALVTEKIETRKRVGPALAIASFCPFCGVPYARQPASPATESGQ